MLHRSIKPPAGDEINFSLPEIKKLKLDNGLPVLFVRRNNLPILRFNLIIDAGSKYDPADKKGLVNLFSMMIDEGAGGLSALELNEEIELLGSNMDVSSSNDNIFISLRTLKENVDKSLELFAKIIISPHFDEDDFLREKRKILTRILQLNDDPDEIADITFEHNLFGENNPYAYPVIGSKNNIENISGSNELKDFYFKYISPLNSVMIVVGDSNESEVKEKLNHHLAEWRTEPDKEVISFNPPPDEKRILLVHKENAVQSEIRIGHLSSIRKSPDYFHKNILNTILGGQFSSRINLNLREDKGYTYGAFSRFSYYKDAAYFYTSTSVGVENTGSAVRELLQELERIRHGVMFEELAFAQSSIIRKFPSNFETNRQIAANLAAIVIHSLPDNYFDSYLDNIKHVTIDDVNAAAVNNIFPDKAMIVIVGDKKKVLPQLKNFGREIVEMKIPVL